MGAVRPRAGLRTGVGVPQRWEFVGSRLWALGLLKDGPARCMGLGGGFETLPTPGILWLQTLHAPPDTVGS